MSLALIRVRGPIKVKKEVNDTLDMLRLRRRNAMSIVEDTPIMKGMIKKVENEITWGELDKDTEKVVQEKKGKGKQFALNSPRKGYGRKGIKVAYNAGGALGYRGEAINDLVQRML